MTDQQMQIGEVAERTGLSLRTIRHYEDLGLVSPERRGTVRVYHRRDHIRMQLIMRGRRLGFSLEEIRRIIGMDAESFVNSVYVQQGDITRLIHADTETRREILDGLLGLHHVDDLVDRMDAVRLEYGKAERDAKAPPRRR